MRACDAAGLVPIVRIPANEGHMITKALDMGAAAVLIPKISSAGELEQAVRASQYAQHGREARGLDHGAEVVVPSEKLRRSKPISDGANHRSDREFDVVLAMARAG